MRRSPVVLAAFLAGGCPWVGGELHRQNMGGHSDTDVLLELDDVDPPYATAGISSSVRVLGAFDPAADYEVYFGPDAAVVDDVQDDWIDVFTPIGAPDGDATVEVVGGSTSASIDGLFHFWPDHSDLAGLTGGVEWYTYLDGSSASGVLWLAVLVPAAFEHYQWQAPRLDSCTNGGNSPGLQGLDLAFDTMTVRTANDAVLTLEKRDPAVWQTDLTASTSSGPWSLDTLPVVDGYAPIALGTLAEMAPPLSVLSPDLSTNPTVYQNAFYLEWTAPSQATDYVHIAIDTYTATGAYVESVHCAAIDDGRFRITPTSFTSWTSGMHLSVRIGRVRTAGDRLPHDQSANEVGAVTYVVGNATAG